MARKTGRLAVRRGHSACGMVEELNKQKYVYYHCTGHRGKYEEPNTREEVVLEQFAAALQELVIPMGILEWLKETVSQPDLSERAARKRKQSGSGNNTGGSSRN